MRARSLTHAPTHVWVGTSLYAHTPANTQRMRHPEHPLCARLFLQGELVVLLSADIKETHTSV